MMIIDVCPVHDEELVDTCPADPENGPSPHDLENEKVCFSCGIELDDAASESVCLAHRKRLVECLPCLYEDEGGPDGEAPDHPQRH